MSTKYDNFVIEQGANAHKQGLPLTANPYLVSQKRDYDNWEKGWKNQNEIEAKKVAKSHPKK